MSSKVSSALPLPVLGKIVHSAEPAIETSKTEVRIYSPELPVAKDNFSKASQKTLSAQAFSQQAPPLAVFHNPAERANHIMAQLPKPEEPLAQAKLRQGILHVLQMEHELDLKILEQDKKLKAQVKDNGLMQNPMAAFSQALAGNKDALGGLQQTLQAIGQLKAQALKARQNFEEELSPQTRLAWQKAYASSGPDALPSAGERAGYLLARLDKPGAQKIVLTERQRDALHKQLESYLVQRDELDLKLLNQMPRNVKEAWLHITSAERVTPATLDEQVDYVHSRLPKQVTATQSQELRKHIHDGLEMSRTLIRPMVTMMAKMSPIFSDVKPASPLDYLRGLSTTVQKNAPAMEAHHQFLQTLEPETRLAWKKAHGQLLESPMRKTTLLLQKLSESVE